MATMSTSSSCWGTVLVTADRPVQDLDRITGGSWQGLAGDAGAVVAIADRHLGVAAVDHFRGQGLAEAVARHALSQRLALVEGALVAAFAGRRQKVGALDAPGLLLGRGGV